MNRRPDDARGGAAYFQVPLCAFAYGISEKDRLDAIIEFGIVEAGAKHWEKLSGEQREVFLANERKAGRLPREFDARQSRHAAAVYGTALTQVTLGSLTHCSKNHQELNTFCRDFESRHGRDPLVRLKSTLVFEARDRTGISARELAVLAGVYSVIGRQQGPVLISQAQIRRRALGYKTAQVMHEELPRRWDGAQPLSDWQLRSVLGRLSARKLFSRTTYGRRLTYYSNRMPLQALRLAVIEKKTYRFTFDRIQRLDDESMTDAIRNQRAALADRPPPSPEARPLSLPPAFTPEDVA